MVSDFRQNYDTLFRKSREKYLYLTILKKMPHYLEKEPRYLEKEPHYPERDPHYLEKEPT